MRVLAGFLAFSLFIIVGAGLKPALHQNGAGPAPATAADAGPKPVLNTVNREFWTWYVQKMPPEDIKVRATCRGIGQNLYVFVNDVDWLRPVTQADVDRIIETFDRSTPTNPQKGIYQIATEAFGQPPDKDGDPKIYILISELGEFRGHHFDGFFRYLDQTNEKGSNQLDMLCVDAHDPASEYHLGVLAHEFQHLIHWRYDPEEEGWVNEALSELCMILCGYYTDKRHVETFLKHTDRPLVAPGHGATSYGACLLWATYIYDRLGLEFIGRWVREPGQGIKGFEDALKHTAVGAGFKPAPTFNSLFADWMVALYINDPGVQNGLYAYKSLSLPFGPFCEDVTSYPSEREGEVSGYGIDYIRFSFPASGGLSITAKGDSPGFLIEVIEPNKENPSLTRVSEHQGKEANILVDNHGSLHGEKEVVVAVTVLEATEKPVRYYLKATLEQ
ncbi:MAG TPA: hypothetical protein ACFYEI_09155 [Candidatus Tripitaka californicus]